MNDRCSIPSEDLVAYADGYLAGGRRELVEAHAAVCPSCRERLRAFREVDEIFQEQAMLRDDPARRAQVQARLAAEARRPARRPNPRLGIVAVSIALVLLVLALLGSPLVSRADFPFATFVRFGQIERKGPLLTPVALTSVAPGQPGLTEPGFPAVAPERLPLGLEQVDYSIPRPGYVEMLYRNQEGLALLLAQWPTGDGVVQIESPDPQKTMTVNGTVVFVTMDPLPDAVAALLWERDGVVFDLLVIGGRPGQLGMAGSVRIVEALSATQTEGMHGSAKRRSG